MDAGSKERIIETRRMSEQVSALEFSERQHLDLIAQQVSWAAVHLNYVAAPYAKVDWAA